MPGRTKPELEAQREILEHVLQGLCAGELNADGRWYIQKLITRINKQIQNETDRLTNQAKDNNHNQHS